MLLFAIVIIAVSNRFIVDFLKLEEKTVAMSNAPLKEPPASFTLGRSEFVPQTFNNCGPATLSMILSYYGKNISQEELATQMRPFNNPYGGEDDKSIFAPEFVTFAEKYGFHALHRPNGDIELIKTLITNDIPVIVRTLLHPGEDIGHFRIVRGYDDTRKIFIQDDSYQGQNIEYGYDEFMSMWQPFNYGYILVYPKEKQNVVKSILGQEVDEKIAYKNTLDRSEKELQQNPSDQYAMFNLATAEYYLGDYKKSVEWFEKAEPSLPSRMLWYQYEPILAYQKVKNYDRVFQLTQNVFYSGDMAFSELYQVRGEVYLEQGNKEEAKGEFEKAVYYNNNFKPAQLSLQAL